MGFSYTAGQDQALDRVRLLIGDTVDNGHRLEDEEIEDFLAMEGLTGSTSATQANERYILRAASHAARAIAGKMGKESEIVITEVGGVKADAANEFRKLADDLEGRATPWLMT